MQRSPRRRGRRPGRCARRKVKQMQPTTVLLISSSHANWVGLQAMLQKQRHLQVIGNVCQRDEAVHTVTVEQPDIIIAASELDGQPSVPLMEEMRAVSPASRIIVVGKLLERAEYARLTELGVRSFLLWEDVTPDKISRVIEAVRAGLRVGSGAVAERAIVPPPVERRCKRRECDIMLTDEERIALNGKVTGLVEREIAVELHASVPTVERILRGLRDKLGVATTCALCARAVSLGLVTLDE